MFENLNNKQYFFDLCEAFINQYETNSLKPSAKQPIMDTIKRSISVDPNSDSFFSSKEQFRYEKLANCMLCNISFDFLASGRYHLYYGLLNPMSEADNIMDVYKGSIDWALNNGEITAEEKEEQFNYLNKLISQVG